MAFNMMSQFASRDVCDLVFCDYSTKSPLVYVDYANSSALNLTGETVYAYGGHGHPKRVGFAGDRGGTIQFETQLSTMKLYSLVTGGVLDVAGSYLQREKVTATSSGLALTETPDANSVSVFKADDDCGTDVGGTVSGKNVTGSGITNGTDYIVYYTVSKSSGMQKIRVSGKTSPKEYEIHGFTYVRGEDGIDRPMRMICWKAMPTPELSINFANNGDPASLTVTFDLEANANGDLIDLVAIDEE